MEKPDAACCKDCCGLRTSFTRCGTVHAKAGHHVGTDRIEIGGLMMTLHLFRNVVRVGIATAVLISLASMLAVDSASAQDPPPPIPPSTNPTERVIYPAEGQTQEQQLTDQLECYRWSTTQTGWDPHQAEAVLRQQHGEAMAQMEASQGGAVGGAARGAIAGLAIGAIAGDAGKGAAIGAAAGGLTGGRRSRRQAQAAQSSFEQDLKAFQDRLAVWDRNYVACMQARKYVVN